ncbi:hypothetical protein [Dactylosporangium sp. NPDC048998]|uniref:hypothetical protein n=1 Tax=Dactylosporangium sp. NPDC048998 TaxID=3363976 RepID=UPI0037210437
MERRKHWWNGTWGRLARRDVYLFEDAGVWWVESREGGADGRSRRYEFTDEDRAMDCVSGLLAQPGNWREIK